MTYHLTDDLNAIVVRLEGDWTRLRGARLFVTGGTGLIGRWMLETLVEADRRLGLGVEAVVLTRDPAAFAAKSPHLAAARCVTPVAGDVLRPLAADGAFSHVIHAATDASAALNEHEPVKMFDTVVTGTRNALDLAVEKRVDRFVFLSSGAVYGAQPASVPRVAEDWLGGPDCTNPRHAYAEGKRAAEMLCAVHAKQHGLDTVTARIFALLGPLLSLNIHFAAGNFIRDAMAGRPVEVAGGGTAVRSYLYLADVTWWLWAMLLRAPAGSVYNVGSEEAVSIAELAELMARVLGAPGHVIRGRDDAGWNTGGYVPSTRRIRAELGVAETVALDEAIRRTAAYNGWKK